MIGRSSQRGYITPGLLGIISGRRGASGAAVVFKMDADATAADSSVYARTVSLSGAAISTAQSKFGGGSLLVSSSSGTSNIATAVNGPELDFGAGDFTVEMWVYPTAYATGILAFHGLSTSEFYPWQAYMDSSGAVNFRGFYDTASFAYSLSGSLLPLAAWTFLQFQRAGSTVRYAVNGAVVASASITPGASLWHPTTAIAIGNYQSGAALPFVGYIDDMRISAGAQAIALPTSALPAT